MSQPPQFSPEIDPICDEFERRWQAGEQPRIEEYLDRIVPEKRLELLSELVAIDAYHRSRNGQPIDKAEYLERFPELRGSLSSLLADLPAAPVGQPPPEEQTQLSAAAVEQTIVHLGESTAQLPATPAEQTPFDALNPSAGMLLGAYRLEKQLGAGGMGTVWQATHLRLEKLVALKLLSPQLVSNEELIARFEREMKAVGRLDHPNLVRAYDAGDEGGVHYLAMEFIDGMDLSQLVRKAGPLPVERAIDLIRQAAVGLSAAHKRGLIHRDIKPGNLMLAEEGQLKITDLGLANLQAELAAQEVEEALTIRGQILGTPDYMAPEQWDDTHAVDGRCDLYALGCTLFYLLVGKAPFAALGHTTLVAKRKAHFASPVPDLRAYIPQISSSVVQVFERLMAKEPADRYATADDLVAALEEILKSLQSAGNDEHRAPTDLALGEFLQTLAPERSTGTEPGSTNSPSRTLAERANTTGTLQLGQTQSSLVSQRLNRSTVGTKRGSVALIVSLICGASLLLLGGAFFLFGRGDKVPTGEPKTITKSTAKVRQEPSRANGPVNGVSANATPILPVSGAPISLRALVSQPTQIPSLRSWSIERAGINGIISSIAWHPSGKFFVTGDGVTAELRVWSADGRLQKIVLGHGTGIAGCGLAFFDEGKRLASLSMGGDPHLRIWDTETWSCQNAVPYPRGWNVVYCMAASSATRQLVIGGSPGVFTLDTVTGRVRDNGNFGRCIAVEYSPDGKTIFLATDDSQLHRLDAETLIPLDSPVQLYPEGDFWAIHALALSPDGTRMAAGGGNGSEAILHLWDPRSGEYQGKIDAGSGGATSVRWFQDSRRLAVTAAGPTISVWDVTQLAEPLITSSIGNGNTLAISPDEQQILATPNGGTQLHSVSVASGASRNLTMSNGRYFNYAMPRLSPDGQKLVNVYDRALTTWDAETGAPLTRMSPVPAVNSWLWSPAGDQVLLYGLAQLDRSLLLVDPVSGKSQELTGRTARIDSTAWSPDGTQVAAGGEGPEISVWNLDTPTQPKTLTSDASALASLAWAADGLHLAATGSDSAVRIWNVSTGELETNQKDWPAQVAPGNDKLAWFPDSRRMWIGYSAGCSLWNLETNYARPPEILGFELGLSGIFLSTDGSSLMLNNLDNASFWLGAAEDYPRYLGHLGIKTAWHRDNRRCLFTAGEGLVRGYDVRAFQSLGSLSTTGQSDESWVVIGQTGHYRGGLPGQPGQPQGDGTSLEELEAIEKHLLYVALHEDGRQVTYTPREFAETFHWKNDPSQASLLRLTGDAPAQNATAAAAREEGGYEWPADAPKPAIAPFDAEQAKQHQAEWAAHLKLPVEYTNSLGMKFRLIPPGEFLMGSPPEVVAAVLKEASEIENQAFQSFFKDNQEIKSWFDSEAAQHRVILTQPIYLGSTEVTQRQYEAVMGTNPSNFSPVGAWKDRIAGLDTANHPVEMVSWNDAAEFCAKLSQIERREPRYFRSGDSVVLLEGDGYRLPSEAEWEFSCRAGTTSRFWSGNSEQDLIAAGWFSTNAAERTHPVAEYKANPFGLFDLHGNVVEWVQDGWDPAIYAEFRDRPAVNPASATHHDALPVVRGGGIYDLPFFCRSSQRRYFNRLHGQGFLGFRVALTVDSVR